MTDRLQESSNWSPRKCVRCYRFTEAEAVYAADELGNAVCDNCTEIPKNSLIRARLGYDRKRILERQFEDCRSILSRHDLSDEDRLQLVVETIAETRAWLDEIDAKLNEHGV